MSPRPSTAQAQGMMILSFTEDERASRGLPIRKEEIAHHLGVHIATVYAWEKQLRGWDATRRIQQKALVEGKTATEILHEEAEEQAPLEELDPSKPYDTLEFFREREYKIDQALYQRALRGDIAAVSLIKRLLGQLREEPLKEGDDKKLTADDYVKLKKEAKNRISDTHRPGTPDGD